MEPEYKNSRISLQFNLLDPDQAEAFSLLKSMGHKKSLIISKALLYYINNNPDALTPFPQSNMLNKLIFKSWIKDIMNELEIPAKTSEPVSNDNVDKNIPPTAEVSKTIKNDSNTEKQIISSKNVQKKEVTDSLIVNSKPTNHSNISPLDDIVNCNDDDLENFLSGLDMFK